MSKFPAPVQALIRLKISTSSDPSHEQMTHVACFGDLIKAARYDHQIERTCPTGTPSFLLMSSEGNVLAKP